MRSRVDFSLFSMRLSAWRGFPSSRTACCGWLHYLRQHNRCSRCVANATTAPQRMSNITTAPSTVTVSRSAANMQTARQDTAILRRFRQAVRNVSAITTTRRSYPTLRRTNSAHRSPCIGVTSQFRHAHRCPLCSALMRLRMLDKPLLRRKSAPCSVVF